MFHSKDPQNEGHHRHVNLQTENTEENMPQLVSVYLSAESEQNHRPQTSKNFKLDSLMFVVKHFINLTLKSVSY
jgi:hypothetical protein